MRTLRFGTERAQHAERTEHTEHAEFTGRGREFPAWSAGRSEDERHSLPFTSFGHSMFRHSSPTVCGTLPGSGLSADLIMSLGIGFGFGFGYGYGYGSRAS